MTLLSNPLVTLLRCFQRRIQCLHFKHHLTLNALGLQRFGNALLMDFRTHRFLAGRQQQHQRMTIIMAALTVRCQVARQSAQA
jgi:hypothetical protein